MKRIISLALTLVLAFSLAIPALAVEDTDPPLWQEYGCTSYEECVEWYFDGDEEAYQAEVAGIRERAAWEAGMAGEIAAFDADDYWNSDDCYYKWIYGSKEEFMEDWLLDTEEEFRETMLQDWLDGQWYAYQQSQYVARTLAELGGVAGQVGVMLDGKYIAFGAAVPQVVNGRTMVPCKPLIEAMGGKVTPDNGALRCTFSGEKPYSSVSEVTLQPDGSWYYKNGCTYVPLRALTDALGYDLFWDSTFDTAVMMDRSKITYELDQKFTVLNRLLESVALDPDKNYKTAVKMDLALTMLDSINGDKTYNMGGTMEMLQSGTTVNLTVDLDLSALMNVPGMADATLVEAAALRSALKALEMEVIYDGEGGAMYLRCSAMGLLTDGAYDGKTWLSVPTATMAELETGSAATVGAMLYASATGGYDSYYYAEPALMYRDLMETAEEAEAYIGDKCFAGSGGYDVLSYDKADYDAALEGEYGEGSAEYLSEFERLELELKVAKSGAATFKVLMQTKDSGYSFYNDVFLIDASGSVSKTRVDMKLLFKLKNTMDLKVSYTASTTETQEKPVTAPAAGAVVADPYEGLYGGEETPPAA